METKLYSAAELTALGAVGSLVAALFGGWTDAMTTLCIFMAIDYLTGVCVAAAGKSKKTKNGSLNSKVGFIGLIKKGMIMVTLIVAARIDLLTGYEHVIKDATCIAFIINELISILENIGHFIPIPEPIKKAIDILKAKEDNKK